MQLPTEEKYSDGKQRVCPRKGEERLCSSFIEVEESNIMNDTIMYTSLDIKYQNLEDVSEPVDQYYKQDIR